MSSNIVEIDLAKLAAYKGAAEVLPVRKLEARPITVKDVAKLAGVSEATVSRVVNGIGNVTGKTTTRVLAAVSSLHYCPNPHAAEMGRSNGGRPRNRGISASRIRERDRT